jgi:SRSO17 transposase
VAEDRPLAFHQVRAKQLIASLPAQAWRVRPAGDGAKGEHRSSWARVRVTGMLDPEGEYWLLARRSLTDPTEITYYLCFAPPRVGLAELARIAGTRWAIEETFQTAKGQTGLDQYQVRQYTGWYRHITLAMLAHAFLTVTRARAAKRGATPEATASSSR